MTSVPRVHGGVTSLSQGVQECPAFNPKTPGDLELRCLPSTESAGWRGLEEGMRQLRLLFLEAGAASLSSVGADTPSPPKESQADGVGFPKRHAERNYLRE